nr:PREDICTED: UPF0515 protein C19orf66 homolog [Latimeria chalumnae]|eukprot:XP_014339283.1 PREDICTED: UPF0515 protein C19orf66 homolog [Latimeria chalumnae]
MEMVAANQTEYRKKVCNQHDDDDDKDKQSAEEDAGEEKEEGERRKDSPVTDENEIGEDADIQAIAEGLRSLPLTRENLKMLDDASRNQIPSVLRQFSCKECGSRSWWRRVPERKQVSRCRWCKTSYDPIPYDRMWGYALYNCPNCNKTFKAYGQMSLASPCFNCRALVTPTEIIPPKQREPRQYRTPEHSCFAEDCYNRREPYVVGTYCVHPMTRRVRGLHITLYHSKEHEGASSTVPTCVSQGDLPDDEDDIIQEDLERIGEEGEGSENGASV